MDRILNMIIRRVIGRLVNRVVYACIDAATRRGNASPEDQARGRTAARNTKGALRMARRIGRF